MPPHEVRARAAAAGRPRSTRRGWWPRPRGPRTPGSTWSGSTPPPPASRRTRRLPWPRRWPRTCGRWRWASSPTSVSTTRSTRSRKRPMTDQLLGGRLVTCLRPAPGAEDRFAEAVEVFMAGLAPRPFRHEGAAWRVPANLPDNVFNIEQRLRVTPTTAQIEPVGLGHGRTHRPARGGRPRAGLCGRVRGRRRRGLAGDRRHPRAPGPAPAAAGAAGRSTLTAGEPRRPPDRPTS